MNDSADAFLGMQAELAGIYSFERELGRGGMGTVFLAREVALDRLVAIKVLDPAQGERPEQRERFLREARTGARLAHPNIVPIFAVGEAAGTVYFVMGLVDGESVSARLHREGPLPTGEVVRIINEIGLALAHAHASGVLHRDVTLDNMLLERNSGRAMLVDFGIAAEVAGASSAALVGTPAYLAPELIQGEAPSAESDLYSLGIATWAMLAGRLPFPEQDVSQVLIHQVTTPVPSLEQAAAATPRRVRQAVEHCLAKAPAERPASIEAWLQELGAREVAPAMAPPLQRWVHRWQGIRVFYALGISIMAMLTSLTGGMGIGLPFWALFVRELMMFVPALLIVLVVHANISWRMLRGLARNGFGIEDLRLAIAREADQARTRPPMSLSLMQRAVLGATIIAAATWLVVSSMGVIRYPMIPITQWKTLAIVARWAHLLFWSGISLQVVNPPFRLDPDGRVARLRRAFWDTGFAKGLVEATALFLPRHRAAEHTLHRPTELMLDIAIEELWAALPRSERRRLTDVPRLAELLRHRAGESREVLRRLEGTQPGGGDEMSRLAQRVRGQERAAIAALERMRIGLLELTTQGATPGDFSQVVMDAATLQGELLAELGADREIVARVVNQRRLRTGSSPTPTPSPA